MNDTEIDAINKTLDKMAEETGKATATQWRAFIEVRDCCDLNNDNKIEEKEKTGEPYWIEVIEFGSGGSSTDSSYDRNAWFAHTYATYNDAADAVGTALDYAHKVWPKKQPPIAGVIAENYDESFGGWIAHEGADPYVRNTPYGKDT